MLLAFARSRRSWKRSSPDCSDSRVRTRLHRPGYDPVMWGRAVDAPVKRATLVADGGSIPAGGEGGCRLPAPFALRIAVAVPECPAQEVSRLTGAAVLLIDY